MNKKQTEQKDTAEETHEQAMEEQTAESGDKTDTSSASKQVVEEPSNDTCAKEDQDDKSSKELEKAQESIKNLTDRLMRTAAEFDNYKKRMSRERDEFYKNAVCDTINALLPVLDNLERAISQTAESDDAAAVMDGVKMVKKQFDEALASIGVIPIDAVGNPFDPEKHNAVMTAESSEDENTILEEFMKGYTYQDKVVRHSMVKVSS